MKIIVNGSNGRMGREVINLLKNGYRDYTIAAAVDLNNTAAERHPLFEHLDDFNGDADCIIDFSHHLATFSLLRYATTRKLPVVIATTGQTEEEYKLIEDASKEIPIFLSANMSVGIALLVELAKTVAKAMPEADIEIVESHHNRKLDVPSGTALLLANGIKEVRPDAEFNVGRSENGKRNPNEIGIHSLRMGNVVGMHEVIIGTDTQIITLKHETQSRSLLAEGALSAAGFIKDKAPGLYNMKNIVEN